MSFDISGIALIAEPGGVYPREGSMTTAQLEAQAQALADTKALILAQLRECEARLCETMIALGQRRGADR